jgi:hypothetical protein
MNTSLFSLTDRNFFQSGIFLPSMTWNIFVWAGFAKAHIVADVFDRYDVKKTPSSRLKESVVPK